MTHEHASWCAHPRIGHGEALSSWLHRSAWANGLGNHSFAQRLLGDRPVWTRDFDRWASIELCEMAAHGMGERLDDVLAGTLRHYEGVVFSPLTLGGWLPWVTPLGVYHRTRRHAGSGYCPACLYERGYAALHWRFAFEVICTRHQCWLNDACPDCGAAFQFHRIDFSVPGRYPCPECHHNLATRVPRAPLSRHALATQQIMNGVLHRHGYQIDGKHVSPIEFFNGARLLLMHLWSNHTSPGMIAGWPRAARLCMQIPSRRAPFEYWPLRERAAFLAVLHPYLTQWPDRYLYDVRRSWIYDLRIRKHTRCPMPEWLGRILDYL